MNFFSKLESWEVAILVICIAVLAVHFGKKIDFENAFKKDSPTPVHMGGNQRYAGNLKKVQAVKIPAYVYESLEQDSQFKRYLTGNHKYILMFTYPGCPYSRSYTHAFKYLFQERGFDEYYRKRVITVGRSTSVSCPGHQDMNCATAWIFQNCFGGLCILNPQRREAIVDNSQDARQLDALLEKYREW